MLYILVYFIVIVFVASLALWAVRQVVEDPWLSKVSHVFIVVVTALLLLGLFLRALEVPLNKALLP